MININGNCCIWNVEALINSGYTSFIDSNGHLYLIGTVAIFDIVTRRTYSLDFPHSFKVQRFIDLEIKIK